MRKHIIEGLKHLNGALILLAVLSAVSSAPALFGLSQKECFLRSLSIMIPLAVSLFAVRNCRGMAVYLLLCLLSIVPVFLIGATILNRIMFLLVSLIVIALRTVGRVRDQDDALSCPSVGILAIFVILYLAGVLMENPYLKTVNFYAAFTYTILVLIYLNLTRLSGYLEVHKNISNVPFQRIGRTNTWVLSIFLGLAVAGMILLPMTGLENLIRAGGRAILALIRRMGNKGQAPDADLETVIDDGAQGTDMGSMPDFGPVSETPVWLTALYKGLTVVLLVGTSAAILYLLVRVIINVVRRFYRPMRENSDEEEFIGPVDEKESLEITGKRNLPGFLDFSPNAQVRRQFRRTVQKKKKVDSDAYTPDELLSYAEVPEGEFRSILHTLYEQARYSKDGVTKEDVRRLKA